MSQQFSEVRRDMTCENQQNSKVWRDFKKLLQLEILLDILFKVFELFFNWSTRFWEMLKKLWKKFRFLIEICLLKNKKKSVFRTFLENEKLLKKTGAAQTVSFLGDFSPAAVFFKLFSLWRKVRKTENLAFFSKIWKKSIFRKKSNFRVPYFRGQKSFAQTNFFGTYDFCLVAAYQFVAWKLFLIKTNKAMIDVRLPCDH